MTDLGSQPPPSPDPRGPLPALRASDVERDRAADQLRQAAGEGLLTVDELDERLTRCYAATTVAELAELTVDVVVSGHDPMPGSARAPGAVVKPDGVEVQITKFALLGGHDVELSDQAPPPGAPVIHLRMLSIMGGGDVNQGRKLTKAERRLQKARERGELSGG